MLRRLFVFVGLIITLSAFSVGGTTTGNDTTTYPSILKGSHIALNVTSTKNSTLFDQEFAEHCTGLRQYNDPSVLDYEDCGVAIETFRSIYVDPKTASTEVEFLTRTARPVERISYVRTPLRWVSNTCVLAIIMLSEFPSGGLPGGGSSGGFEEGNSGLATFGELYRCAQQLDVDCAFGREQAGWAALGEHLNIGLFLWRTGSDMDRKFFSGSNNFTLPSHKRDDTQS